MEIEPPVDPLVAVQEIRSHIGKQSWVPIPVEHNNGLLRIFEDYRKVRDTKEQLDTLIKEVLGSWQTAQEEWTETEFRYQQEIRRLELLIAKGSTGMAGLMNARKGTIVDRNRTIRRIRSTESTGKIYDTIPNDQLDDEIHQRSQKGGCCRSVFEFPNTDWPTVGLHRPSSPSAAMAALSKKLQKRGSADELPVGTPPQDDGPTTFLTRKVKSEQDLLKLGNVTRSRADSNAPTDMSGESFSTTPGDPLPDEVDPSVVVQTPADLALESEAFVALSELATLVARRRGIDAEVFITKLMSLYAAEDENKQTQEADEPQEALTMTEGSDDGQQLLNQQPQDSEARLRHFKSQPQLRRRHFSFDPGQDDVGIFNEGLRRRESTRPKSPAGSQSTVSSDSQDGMEGSVEPSPQLSRTLTLGADAPKPTKIPSPLHRPSFGSTRRESSTSSLKTVKYRMEPKRDSRSSVITAFRETPSGSIRGAQSTSRASSVQNLRLTENDDPRNSNGSLKLRTGVVALAAARAAGATASSSTSTSRTTSPGKENKKSTSRASRETKTPLVDSTTTRSGRNEVPRTRQ